MMTNGHGPSVITLPEGQNVPYSLDAEKAVLASILVDRRAYYDIADKLTPADFYVETHGRLFKLLAALIRDDYDTDPITVAEAIAAKGIKLGKDTDAMDFVLQLQQSVSFDPLHVESHAAIVAGHAQRRRAIRAAARIASAAYSGDMGPDALMELVQETVHNIAEHQPGGGLVSIRDGILGVLELVEQRSEQKLALVGLPTGLKDLDRMLRGLKPSTLYVIAGRAGMGKSILENATRLHVGKLGKHVAAFNLEMSAESVYMRMLAAETGIPFDRLELGRLEDREWPIFMEAAGRLSELAMWLDDTPSLTVTQLETRCRRLHMEHSLDLITVDYLQLMGGDRNTNNRTQEVGQISRALKRIAMTLNVPVVALAQLSRAVEQRADKRPLLSDLRESGDIENDADVVIVLYRDDYYKGKDSKAPNEIEINVAKHRNGPTGLVDAYFDGATMKVADLSYKHQQEIKQQELAL